MVLSFCSRPVSERIQSRITMSLIGQIRITSVEFDLSVANAGNGTEKEQQFYGSRAQDNVAFLFLFVFF